LPSFLVICRKLRPTVPWSSCDIKTEHPRPNGTNIPFGYHWTDPMVIADTWPMAIGTSRLSSISICKLVPAYDSAGEFLV
jgi:hypothetical protein